MNSKKQIEDQVLEIGAKAKRASLKSFICCLKDEKSNFITAYLKI